MFRRLYQTAGYSQPNGLNKELILAVLNSTATKREAQNYLKKYGSDKIQNHCLVMIRGLLKQDSKALSCFAVTIKRLKMLGVKPMFVLHPGQDVEEQAQLLDYHLHKEDLRAVCLSEALVRNFNGSYQSIVQYAQLKDLIPIIKPRIFDEKTCASKPTTNVPELMGQLVRQLDCHIDKVVIISDFGGISSGERQDNAHVFINLSQEFESLSDSLSKDIKVLNAKVSNNEKSSVDAMQLILDMDKLKQTYTRQHAHLEDLQIMDRVLSELPISATGIITALSAASNLFKNNPLLHNVLTDRSLISSSLPRFKRGNQLSHAWYELPVDNEPVVDLKDAALITTVVKKGVNIKVFDYRTLNEKNSIGFPGISSLPTPSNDKVNITKLKAIIDQSFGRKLDIKHYLKRINGQIAAIIVIGDYEGIAILTFEGPEGAKFPYLDKFAVMPHLKGSLGISDIMFNLMFQKFPKELVWRSRSDNVVNKWYFQRSVGVLDLSMDLGKNDAKPSIFKLFFHGDNDKEDPFCDFERLQTYSKYVRDIQPSWDT
ncbi:acetyl-CoA:L-glutamate N-acetyltransferase [Lachancea thermotolerans CBS 6340]|uniref:Amino-acid acetyltransferase, mitochondrial n=1 Tax=Lachancea thermotolerans (strain ATCC 56472 / CBS 6340 / NRRL Y-8284) TaxID=559295 RepID=C5E341_LACTC|nr:KLTH0H10186p [Lachancea thermotolerans CBS 6340]CAR30452.1 KLTH0H10186p [Lachancea thermotolerans CBS 6340]